MARVVVTGGGGFLGSHVCEALLDRGDEVVAMDNFATSTASNVDHLFARPRFTMVRHDVSEYVWVPGSVDVVMHLASPASPRDYLELPIQTLKVGSRGTHNTLGLAKAKGARYFLASTSEVYGDPQVHPQTESYWGHVNPVGPRGVYDEAKRFAEAMAMAYHRYHGIEVRIARIFNTYGPRMRLNDGRVVSNFLVQALEGKPLTVYGDGSQTPQLLLCRRHGSRPHRVAGQRRRTASEHRQLRRVSGVRPGPARPRRDRFGVRDSVRATSRRRPDPAPT